MGRAAVYLTLFVPPSVLVLDRSMDSNASPTHSGFPSDPFPNEKENSVKEMEEKTPSGQPIIDREKVCQTFTS